jgi:transglutaminase-like putative cysteine protease
MMAARMKLLRPMEGWITFALALVVVACVPAAALAADWVPKDEGLVPLAIVGLLIGRWLGRRAGWDWRVWLPVGASVGLMASFSVASHTVLFILPGSGERVLEFVQRLGLWLRAAATRGTSDDPDVFLFLASLLCWLAVFWSARIQYRRHRPLLSLLPLIVPTAVSVFYSQSGIGWLVALLGCGTLLSVAGELSNSQRTWESRGVDYATDLESTAAGAAIAASLVVTTLSYFAPQFSLSDVSDRLGDAFHGPSAEVEDAAERLFGGVSPARRGSASGGGPSSYLPRSRLLGGSPELLDSVVMKVWTDEPPPPPEYLVGEREYMRPPPHYWHGVSFDDYSGRGWSVTIDARGPAEGELPVFVPPSYDEVDQRFEFTSSHGDTLYALSVPAIVTGPIESIWHTAPAELRELDGAGEELPDDGDLAGLASEVVSYTVVSRVPKPTASALRMVPARYAAQVVDLYLQLPNTVPRRVIDLAEEVTSPGATVYEKVRLVEQYLRQYPYSLEVDAPPEGRDVADFFLFDSREGYCDYYATAFVVMARAVGIPSRLVSGYVGGQYDDLSGAYLIRQYNSHSWPEVYFPGWGWIGFEPTGSQPVRELPEEVRLPSQAVAAPSGPSGRVVRSRWRMAGLAIAGATTVGLLVLWARRRRRRAPPPLTVPSIWNRIAEAGRRMGLAPDPALTPHEYAEVLALEMDARARRTRYLQQDWLELAQRGGATARTLAEMYTARAYSQRQVREWDEAAARRQWERLRPPLRWFRWLGKPSGPSAEAK